MIAAGEYWWNGSCEYADIVYGCDYAAEFQTARFQRILHELLCTGAPRTFAEGLRYQAGHRDPRRTRRRPRKRTKDKRFEDYWKFVREDKVSVYAQRIFDGSQGLAGFKFPTWRPRRRTAFPP